MRDNRSNQATFLDFGLLPIMIFFLAIGLSLALSALAWLAVVLLGTAAHKAVLKMAGPHEVLPSLTFPSPPLPSLSNSLPAPPYLPLRLWQTWPSPPCRDSPLS